MRLGDYLNKLGWSQADLAKHANISTGTVKRVLLEETISRKSAQAICFALSRAVHQEIEISDINEIHMRDFEREDGTTKKHGFFRHRKKR